jgi:hypothetical protein
MLESFHSSNKNHYSIIMKHYSKSDIDTHRLGYGHTSVPAVNVKSRGTYLVPAIMKEFKCCEATAQKASEYVWASAVESFWEQAPELAEHFLAKAFNLRSFKCYSEGRSGGWLYVQEIENDIESWNAIKVSAWGRFEKALRKSVEWHSSAEFAIDCISANEWAPADGLLDDEEAEAEEKSHWECRDTVTEI